VFYVARPTRSIETRSFPNSLVATLAILPSMSRVPRAPFLLLTFSLRLRAYLGVADHSVSVNLYPMSSVVKIDPEIMSGAPCFAGTRVPIQNLIDYFEGGDSIDEFLEDFPSVRRDQVISFLEEAKESVLARAV
jgi:uncharacterized protein (DUF433 family)